MLHCMIVGCLIVVDLLVMFLSSMGDIPADTPATRQPFSPISSLYQQLRSSEPPLGWVVQSVSKGVKIICNSRLQATERCQVSSTLGWLRVIGGVGMNLSRTEDWKQFDPCLD